MELEIVGQLRGPECRVIPSAVIPIREKLALMFQQVDFKGISKLSLIFRVGGSLGEFDHEPTDGHPVRKRGVLVCDIVVRNHGWATRSDAEIRSILASQLCPAITECCRYLNIGTGLTNQVLSELAQQSAPLDSPNEKEKRDDSGDAESGGGG